LFEGKHKDKKQKDFVGLNVLLALTINNLTSQTAEGGEEALVQKEERQTYL